MAFCLPRLRAIRRYIAPSRVSVFAAVIAACPSPPRRYGLPLPVRPGPGCFPGLPAAGRQPGPPGGVPGGGELGGAGAELGDDGPARGRRRPGGSRSSRSASRRGSRSSQSGPPQASPQAVQTGAVPGTAASCCPICSSRAVISALIASIGPQVQRDLGGVDVSEPAGQRLVQLRLAGLEQVVAERGQRRRGPFPATRASRNRRPLTPNRSEITTEIFSSASSRIFFHPGLVPRLVLSQPGPGPGQHPQVPDRLRGHE